MTSIDLFTDSSTKPTAAMLQAMIAAEVGDEQRGTDPTVLHLEAQVAELLGHEAGLFLPSGTMCNAIAIRLHIRPGGDEIILHEDAHPADSEAGGAAAMSGASLRTIRSPTGKFGAAQVRAAIRAESRYAVRSRLLVVEQPTNLPGGVVWRVDEIDEVLTEARVHGLRTHLDGARLCNAGVALDVPVADFARGFDTAWIDLAKGLGCPAGAVLVGSAALIEEAWRYKQMWGGAMRQTGILAAAGLYALSHHVQRLREDHRHARLLADGLAAIPGVSVDPAAVETNIVSFGVDGAIAVAEQLADEGVELLVVAPDRLRAVTHLGIERADVETAVERIASVLFRRSAG